MGKGILLEMGGREAVVLTPQGEFKKVPVPKGTWEIGDEIVFAETQQQPIWAKWGLAAAAAAILVLAPVGIQQYQLSRPAAIVTLDINPSLELTLNKVDDVLSARGLNADGEALLQHVNTKGRPALNEVVEAATEAAVDMNKLDPADRSGAVLLAVAPVGDQELPVDKAENLREKAKQAAADGVSQAAKKKGAEPKTNVAGVVVTPEEKKAAEQAGVSPGKYTFFEELQQVAPQVQLEDVKNSGPGKLLKNLNINPGEFFSQAEENHGADDQNKPERKSEDKTEQQAVPTGGKADDKQSGNGKSDNPGNGNDKQDQKPDDKGNGQSEPKKEDKQQDQNHGNGAPQENKGNAGGNEKKVEPGNKGNDKKQESPDQKDKGNDKKDSWTIPFLGITIEKPSFLQKKDDKPAEPAAPAVATPRADEPGAGAPSDKQSDKKQPDQKQPEQKGSDQKGSDQKQSDQKQSDQKQSDNKGSPKGQEKNNGKDSGKSDGKDKGD